MIWIDASRLSDQPTGIETCSNELIPRIMRRLWDRATLIFPWSAADNPLSSLLRGYKHICIPRQRLWTQFAVPVALFRAGWRRTDVFYTPSYITPWLLRKSGIGTVHDIGWRFVPQVYSDKQIRELEWSTRYQLGGRALFVSSQTTLKHLTQEYSPHCPVIPAVLWYESRHTDIRNTAQNQRKNIVFIGRLDTKKNLQALVEAFERIADEFPDTQLVFAGRDEQGAQELKAYAQKSPFQNRILFLWYITEQQKKQVLTQARCVYLGSHYEGFGIPVLEALDAGALPICSDIPTSFEVLGEDPMFLFHRNLQSTELPLVLRQALVLDDAAYRHAQEAWWQRLTLFDWETTADIIAQTLLKYDGQPTL